MRVCSWNPRNNAVSLALLILPSTFRSGSLALAGAPYEFIPKVCVGLLGSLESLYKEEESWPISRYIPHPSSYEEPHLSSHIVVADR